jgi:hypothetical protein
MDREHVKGTAERAKGSAIKDTAGKGHRRQKVADGRQVRQGQKFCLGDLGARERAV